MCGITGIWDKVGGGNPCELSAICRRMADSIAHRGPDDQGAWHDVDAFLYFSHRRLSIIDLSPSGHQPMSSHDGRWVIVFNGEIYNHHNIRAALNSESARPWRGTSDTETMLEAIADWGVEAALQRFNGMFAFALWDRANHVLTLARDRLGEKPLYYGWMGDFFVFASELKAIVIAGRLLGTSSSVFELDREALALFLRYQYVPAPWSIYRGIRKLPPAHFLQLQQSGRQNDNPSPYWCLQNVVSHGIEHPFEGDLHEGIEELERRLQVAIGLRMEADVPLGAFLSGGIDSTSIVALMQSQSPKPIHTFTIKFAESSYDESMPAGSAAKHLGTAHTELLVTPKEALDTITHLPVIYDEPFADASQIPTSLICRLTRQHVTVALTGDGGDEIFGGYYRHFMAPILWQRFSRWPYSVRRGVAAAFSFFPESAWQRVFDVATRHLGNSWRTVKLAGRLQKLMDVIIAETPDAMYNNLLSYWKNPEILLNDPLTVQNPLADLSTRPSHLPKQARPLHDTINSIMFNDAISYLPNDILVKVDRASMAASLETRVPFLDHKLVSFVWSLPMEWKIRAGKGKWILRQVLRRYVPEEIFDRPKTGFAVPIDHWLRNELRDWAEALIDETRLKNQGIFNASPIRHAWREHLSGRCSRHYQLWTILMFQSWLEENKSSNCKFIEQ